MPPSDSQLPPPPPHMAAASTSRDQEFDNDSSCCSSTVTAPASGRSGISGLSFSSLSSISVGSFGRDSAVSLFSCSHASALRFRKPHKANQAEWEAIRRLQAATGRVGLEHFQLLRRIGSGDIGNVYLCRLRGIAGCDYAMKVMDREALSVRKKLQRAEMEREILATLDHPFLPTLYASLEAAHYSCLVMEFCPGGDLHAARQRQLGRRFSVSSAKFYAAEILLALEYLHMVGVVYRDLKPENVLVRADGHIMLSDFDLSFKCDVVPRLLSRHWSSDSKSSWAAASCVPPSMQSVLSCFYGGRGKCTRKMSPQPTDMPSTATVTDEDVLEELEMELVAEPVAARSRSFVGTHEYLAPEVISGTGHGSAVDWWTLGMLLYELLFGRTPFRGDNNEKTLSNILKQPLSFPRMAANGKDREEMARAQDLICKLLAKNAKKRIGSLKGSVEIKRHDFFKGVNWALIRSVRAPEVPRDLKRAREPKAAAASTVERMLSKKERDEAHYSTAQHFDYF